MQYKTWLWAGMLLLLPWVAHAAGLGKLTISSALGWPLQAEIDLISVPEDDIASFKARIASPEVFKRANVQYSPALIGVRLSIERRADGQPYIKIISTRPVNEPFIDLLVELSWAQGQLVREYTALIDPQEFLQGAPIVQAVPPVEPAPAVMLESQARAPTAPVAAKPAAKAPAVTRPAVAPARAGSKEYGPVKEGETLSNIAASIKPKGVTLEQMLLSLYQANPDAFGASMNVLKEGAMLRIPEEQQGAAATAQSDAAEGARVRATGKERPTEVLRLSRVELTDSAKTGNDKGLARGVAELLRALEAEVAAREKALTEANERIAQLEQTVRSMRRQIGVTEQLPGVSAAGTLPQPAKMEPARDAGQMTAAAPASGEQAAPAVQPATAGPPQGEVLKAEAPQARAGAPTQPKPAIIDQAPRYLIDQIREEPLYLAGGGLLALLGGAGYWFARRRRTLAAAAERRVANVISLAATVDSFPATVDAHVASADPLAEANLFFNFGRDERAEEILIEVLEEDPANEAAQFKLLQIYARRKDKAAYEKIAHNLHAQTQGAGDTWLKTASMGYELDPGNQLYEVGQPAPAVTVPAARDAAGPAGAGVELPPPASVATETETETVKLESPPLVSSVTETETAKRDAGAINGELAAQLDKMIRAVEAPETPRDAGAEPAAATAAPEFVAPDITLNLPDGMQPPAAPGSEAGEAGVTREPAAPMIGTIDFEPTAPAPATPDNARDTPDHSRPREK